VLRFFGGGKFSIFILILYGPYNSAALTLLLIQRHVFFRDRFVLPFSHSWATDLYQLWRQHRRIFYMSYMLLYFETRRLKSKGTAVDNRCQIVDRFTP